MDSTMALLEGTRMFPGDSLPRKHDAEVRRRCLARRKCLPILERSYRCLLFESTDQSEARRACSSFLRTCHILLKKPPHSAQGNHHCPGLTQLANRKAVANERSICLGSLSLQHWVLRATREIRDATISVHEHTLYGTASTRPLMSALKTPTSYLHDHTRAWDGRSDNTHLVSIRSRRALDQLPLPSAIRPAKPPSRTTVLPSLGLKRPQRRSLSVTRRIAARSGPSWENGGLPSVPY